MVVDTSALTTPLLGEPEAERVALALQRAAVPVIAAPTLVEALIVVQARLGADGVLDLEQVLAEAGIEIVAALRPHSNSSGKFIRNTPDLQGRHKKTLRPIACLVHD